MKLRYLSKIISVLLLASPLVAFAQLSNETYEVIGLSIGTPYVSINATSTSYSVIQSSGASYISNPVVTEGSAVRHNRVHDSVSDMNASTTSGMNASTTSDMNAPATQIVAPEYILGTTNSVSLCHFIVSNVFQPKSLNVQTFIESDTIWPQGHNEDIYDIIPPFYYDIGDGLFLYSGKNWTTSNSLLFAHNCKAQIVSVTPTLSEGDSFEDTEVILEMSDEDIGDVVEIKTIEENTEISEERTVINMSDGQQIDDVDTVENWSNTTVIIYKIIIAFLVVLVVFFTWSLVFIYRRFS